MSYQMSTRSYSELMKLKTFKERFEYLKLNGSVAEETFGIDRYLNQKFYASQEWKRVRGEVIRRDMACDLGIPEYELYDKVYIHHMNPISVKDISEKNQEILNPEYLICVSKATHDAIHYGIDSPYDHFAERSPNDTCPWKGGK